MSGTLEAGQPEDTSASLTLDEDGAVEKFELPDRAPDWMNAISTCVFSRLRFIPERRDGKPVDARATLTMIFTAEKGQEGNLFRLLAFGPLLTPPHLAGYPGSTIMRCVPDEGRRSALSSIDFVAIVSADGRASEIVVPIGSPEWISSFAKCLQRGLSFHPGTRDGVPVMAQARMPVSLHFESMSGSVKRPSPHSTPEELEAAYRACYPHDLDSRGSVFFAFDVNQDGSLSKIKLARGSGDTRLDEAAACVLPRLRFSPLMHGKAKLKSRITWELPMRPPR